ncbi:MAG: hypothetical protein F6K56_28965 [Moorea sp. SIO3G5]|nr:hypothetical protein [Moorena sp. SIO3G5]
MPFAYTLATNLSYSNPCRNCDNFFYLFPIPYSLFPTPYSLKTNKQKVDE